MGYLTFTLYFGDIPYIGHISPSSYKEDQLFVICNLYPESFLQVYLFLEVLCFLSNLFNLAFLNWGFHLEATSYSGFFHLISYLLDLLQTTYLTYGCFLLLFQSFTEYSEPATLAYMNMIFVIVLHSPKISVFFLVSALMLLFLPCLLYMLLSHNSILHELAIFGNYPQLEKNANVVLDLKLSEKTFKY